MNRDDEARAIGRVISVSADHFIVELNTSLDDFTIAGFDDIHYIARLGSFLIIPIHTQYIVVEIIGLRERDNKPHPQSEDYQLEQSHSVKYLDVVPLGMLPIDSDERFRFGVTAYPTLYSDVLYPFEGELDRIFEVESEITSDNCQKDASIYRTLTIGESTVFDGYTVKIKINEFFGGHSAVLGNTGSGKSCTISSILQSLYSKGDEYYARGATFIIFDINGEYEQSLNSLVNRDKINVRNIIVDGSLGQGKLVIPHWFLNVNEWELLLQASERTQLPVLRNALSLTSLLKSNSSDTLQVKEHYIAKCILECFRGADGDSPVGKFQRVVSLLTKYPTANLNKALLEKYNANYQYGNFGHNDLELFLNEVREYVHDDIVLEPYKLTPFTFEDLEECLDFAILYEEAHGNRQIRDYCSQMVTRFMSLKERPEFEFIRNNKIPTDADGYRRRYIEKILGVESLESQYTKKDQILIFNMNAIEDEVIEVVVAVIARMIFDILRRSSPRNTFPVHLILEEAHRYISKSSTKYSFDANLIYERIAKEGRKYGLFLLVASQRPSDVSTTVLSQCSNFLIHRIQNPDDLSHIRQMTPFVSESVLKRLPSLPKQFALAFGSAVNIPSTFRVRKADPLPMSDDAEIGNLWFREENAKSTLEIR